MDKLAYLDASAVIILQTVIVYNVIVYAKIVNWQLKLVQAAVETYFYINLIVYRVMNALQIHMQIKFQTHVQNVMNPVKHAQGIVMMNALLVQIHYF